MSSRRLPAAVLAALLCSSSPLISAQMATDGDSTVIYPATYFDQWSPVTAQDMINRIPGLSSPTGGNFGRRSSGRGLGGGGGNQILIDGKRVAGKNNEANSQLQRISADKVSHIELIRGTSAEHDVRGDLILNIVLTEAMSARSWSYELNTDRYMDGHVQPGGKVAVNGTQGFIGYVFSAEAEPRHDFRTSRENSVLGDFSPNDHITEERTRNQYTYTLAANLSWEMSLASNARLNMQYDDFDNRVDVQRSITDLTVSSPQLLQQRERTPGRNRDWEIGGDYEYRRLNNHLFKVLFIANEAERATDRERFEIFGDGSEIKDLFVGAESSEREQIIRSSYSMSLREGQDMEFGVERARTILHSDLRLGTLGSGPGSPLHGGLVPVAVSNANSTVEEIRYEPFVVHNWQMSPRMALESTLIYEMSEITQTGDVFNQRDFDFIKPSVDWRFDIRPGVQMRASATKSVRQLSFSDFVASSDTRDDDDSIMAGNVNLRQEQVWNFSVGGEYRLPNDGGVIDGSVFYMEHYDVIERVDVTRPGGRLRSANGNIGDGNMWGLNLNGSVRMTPIGMPNVLITSRFTVKDSEITDPFLGTTRRFQNYDRGRFQLGFRHDVSRFRMTWGANWNNRLDGNIKRYDIDNIESTYGDPNITAFIEFVTPQNIRVRFDARNATNNPQCRIRTRYDGRISDGNIREIEDFCFKAARVVSVKINGTF